MSDDLTLSAAAVQRAIEHMNDDHRDSMVEMVQTLTGYPWATDAEMLGLDLRGIDIRATGAGQETTTRLLFATPLTGPQELRPAIIALAQRAREGAAK